MFTQVPCLTIFSDPGVQRARTKILILFTFGSLNQFRKYTTTTFYPEDKSSYPHRMRRLLQKLLNYVHEMLTHLGKHPSLYNMRIQ